MVPIKLLSPKKKVDVDCFRIGFEIPELVYSDHPIPHLIVVIEDKFPEITQKVLPVKETFTVKKVSFSYIKGMENAPVTLNIRGEITESRSETEVDNDEANLNIPLGDESSGTQIEETSDTPDFKFRRFYYRLTNDEQNLQFPSANPNSSEWQYPQFEAGNYKEREVSQPKNYRVRFLHENSQWKVIYRFDIEIENEEEYSTGSAFFTGNNLVQIFIKDENEAELLLCSAEVEVEDRYQNGGNTATVKVEKGSLNPYEIEHFNTDEEGQKAENSKSFKKRKF